jgi:membrane protein implicated in regulation of membrane protease activity
MSVDRAFLAAIVLHVLAVVALLVAIAAGVELRVVLALVGAVAASLAWSTWLRMLADHDREIERAAATRRPTDLHRVA